MLKIICSVLIKIKSVVNAFGSISCMLIVKRVWTCHMEFALYKLIIISYRIISYHKSYHIISYHIISTYFVEVAYLYFSSMFCVCMCVIGRQVMFLAGCLLAGSTRWLHWWINLKGMLFMLFYRMLPTPIHRFAKKIKCFVVWIR